MKFRRINRTIRKCFLIENSYRDPAIFAIPSERKLGSRFSTLASARRAGIKGEARVVRGFRRVAFDAFVVDRVSLFLSLFDPLIKGQPLGAPTIFHGGWIDIVHRGGRSRKERELVRRTVLFFSILFYFSPSTLGMEKVNAQSRHRY